jgi:hypothetical protein
MSGISCQKSFTMNRKFQFKMMTTDDENQRVGSDAAKFNGRGFRIWLTGRSATAAIVVVVVLGCCGLGQLQFWLD